MNMFIVDLKKLFGTGLEFTQVLTGTNMLPMATTQQNSSTLVGSNTHIFACGLDILLAVQLLNRGGITRKAKFCVFSQTQKDCTFGPGTWQ